VNRIIWIVGLIVVILFILCFFGLRRTRDGSSRNDLSRALNGRRDNSRADRSRSLARSRAPCK